MIVILVSLDFHVTYIRLWPFWICIYITCKIFIIVDYLDGGTKLDVCKYRNVL